jgi:hypothetical protein
MWDFKLTKCDKERSKKKRKKKSRLKLINKEGKKQINQISIVLMYLCLDIFALILID